MYWNTENKLQHRGAVYVYVLKCRKTSFRLEEMSTSMCWNTKNKPQRRCLCPGTQKTSLREEELSTSMWC